MECIIFKKIYGQIKPFCVSFIIFQSEKLSVVRKQKADLSTRIIELEVNLSEVTDQLDERSSNLETLQANYNTVVTEIENEREWYKEVMNDAQAKKGNDSSMYV